MAVIVRTVEPRALLQLIKQSIKDSGIETWSVDSDGDFTHTPPQWSNEAWFRPVVQEDRLIFNILTPKSRHLSRTIYGIYHGRFIEMLLTHFDTKFSSARATALPIDGDIIKP